MFSIFSKEVNRFFSNITGYIVIILFLLACGLFLFVLPNTNLFDIGYADLDGFFSLAPWILIFLVPAVAMQSFPEEYRNGTFEILRTAPVAPFGIVFGKYAGILLILLLVLLPTVLYAVTISSLNSGAGIDTGAMAASYIGLYFLAAVFAAISICCSASTANTIAAFLISAFMCALLYYGFTALSDLPAFAGNADYYIQQAGIDFHYRSISKGVLDSRDLIYFLSLIGLALLITAKRISSKK